MLHPAKQWFVFSKNITHVGHLRITIRERDLSLVGSIASTYSRKNSSPPAEVFVTIGWDVTFEPCSSAPLFRTSNAWLKSGTNTNLFPSLVSQSLLFGHFLSIENGRLCALVQEEWVLFPRKAVFRKWNGRNRRDDRTVLWLFSHMVSMFLLVFRASMYTNDSRQLPQKSLAHVL